MDVGKGAAWLVFVGIVSAVSTTPRAPTDAPEAKPAAARKAAPMPVTRKAPLVAGCELGGKDCGNRGEGRAGEATARASL